jgi:aminoglycoside/choline kinase family phosphotransferase
MMTGSLATLRRRSPLAWVARQAFLRLNGLGAARTAPMPAGASERAYERLLRPGGTSVVLAHDFGRGRAARLARWRAAAQLIGAAGVETPEVLAAWPTLGLSLQTDLGDQRVGVEGIDAALAALVKVQQIAVDHVRAHVSREVLDDGYFARRIARARERIERAVAAGEPAIDREMLDVDHGKALEALGRASAVAVHSDFQSENILWRCGAGALVDCQDLRAGPPHWDVASLAVDPQLGLDAAKRARLLRRYVETSPAGYWLEARDAMAELEAVCAYRTVDVYGTFLALGGRYRRWLPRLSETRRELA